MRLGVILCCGGLFLAGNFASSAPAAKPDDTPTFQLRARVLSLGGKEPVGKKFSFRFSVPSKPAMVTGSVWSDWLKFGPEQVAATLKGYPALYLKGYPVVVKLQVGGVADPTRVEVELKFDEGGEVVKMSGELYGPTLGILLWREAKKPRAATMAAYNRRYWKALEKVRITAEQRPKRFPIVDRFIGGDNDRIAWREGIEQLARVGFSAVMLPPSRPTRDLLLASGLRRTAWAIYNPPGYAFDFDPKITPASLAAWAEKQAKPYRDAGYAAEDMALFSMSDEPGWYYPHQYEALIKNPAALKRFRDYLKAQKLQPADVGGKNWDQIRPLSRSKTKDLASRRLFYWTMRFFAHDSERHFANCTRALEKAFYPGMPIMTNWNNFSGRLYVPGPVANNKDKQSADAAMGAQDWLEFGRLRGGTMMWTEDWFGDNRAYQWSFYCCKLRCAAEKSKVRFGGYIVPRAAGDRGDGILQKILCVAGSGGKAIEYFVFGPEYNFPGNCYSEKARLLPKMAEAHRAIGIAEELLWPGKRPKPKVAILLPRSAQLWDAKDIAVPRQIQDATNNNLNGATVDYMAEVFDLYLALQHANIPVDVVDEDDLSPNGLQSYRVVYITEPDIPIEGQRGLSAWVKNGGTLVRVSGAGTRDRYDEPCGILDELSAIRERPRQRLLVASTKALKTAGKIKEKDGKAECTAVGVRGIVEKSKGDVLAAFEDGSPAILTRTVEKGRVVHFAWLPGLSYWKSSTTTKDRLPVGFSEAIRRWIVYPTELAKIQTPVGVDRAMVETPLLLSEKGAAVTLLNWTGEPQKQVKVTVRTPFAVRSIVSVEQGKIAFENAGDAMTFTLPLTAADIVRLRP